MNKEKDVLDLLNDRISSIQSHRQTRQDQRTAQQIARTAAWEEFLSAAGKLRASLRSHPKLRYFSIARDGSQVAVSFREQGAESGLVTFYYSHPDGKVEVLPAFWCREAGRIDEKYDNSSDVIDRLVRHCAQYVSSDDGPKDENALDVEL